MINDPKEIRGLLLAADISLLLFVLSLVLVGIWALRRTLPKNVRARYPRRVIAMSQLPFTEQWRTSVSPEDLPFFLSSRRGRHVLFLMLLLETHFLAFQFYLRNVVELWRCMNASVR
jgi:hypothetical protein